MGDSKPRQPRTRGDRLRFAAGLLLLASFLGWLIYRAPAGQHLNVLKGVALNLGLMIGLVLLFGLFLRLASSRGWITQADCERFERERTEARVRLSKPKSQLLILASVLGPVVFFIATIVVFSDPSSARRLVYTVNLERIREWKIILLAIFIAASVPATLIAQLKYATTLHRVLGAVGTLVGYLLCLGFYLSSEPENMFMVGWILGMWCTCGQVPMAYIGRIARGLD